MRLERNKQQKKKSDTVWASAAQHTRGCSVLLLLQFSESIVFVGHFDYNKKLEKWRINRMTMIIMIAC